MPQDSAHHLLRPGVVRAPASPVGGLQLAHRLQALQAAAGGGGGKAQGACGGVQLDASVCRAQQQYRRLLLHRGQHQACDM